MDPQPGQGAGTAGRSDLLAGHGFLVAALERSAIGMAVLTADAVLGAVNPALCRMLDLGADDLRGRSLVALCHPEDVAVAIPRLQDLLAGRTPSLHLRLRLVGRVGDDVWVDLSMTRLPDDDLAPAYLAQVVDVGTEVANFEVLQRTAHQFRMLAENASDVVYQTDGSGVIRWVSPSVTAVLGWDPASLVGTHATSLVAPDDQHLLPSRTQDLRSGAGGAHAAVLRFRTLGGAYRDMALTARPVMAGDGLPDGAVIGLRDVTDEQTARRTLARSEERFRLAMAAAPHGMAIADSTGCFVQVNAALCELLGVSRPEILGRTFADFLGPDDHGLLAQVDNALLVMRQDSVSIEHHLLAPHREVWVVHAVSILRDERGVPLFFVHQFVDQTEARRLRADLEHRASRDGLTGVSNRPELMNRLALHLQGGADSGVGLLFVDVDALKPINDDHGHKAGDDVITAVAERLMSSVRRQDLVARIGGDEFVVVLDGVQSLEEVRRVAEKCRAAVSLPVDTRGRAVAVTVSIGAVMASPSDTPDHLLIRADEALYRAKQGGRNQVELG